MLSGTTPSFAVIFRSNTHTAPNARLPLIAQTHDSACNCRSWCSSSSRSGATEDDGLAARVQLAAQRAMSNTTRYFGGYMSKVQHVGRQADEQAKGALATLRARLAGRHPHAQLHSVVSRFITDWECKGVARTAFEEMNLALHAADSDPLAAESVLGFSRQPFYGLAYLQCVSQAVRGQSSRGVAPKAMVEKRAEARNPPPRLQALVYAYRPLSPEFKYLSPWEFTRF